MSYTPTQVKTLFNKIVKSIENGKSLRATLKMKDMPDASTFYVWLNKDEAKAQRYARATELRAELIFEDILNIADENYQDTYVDEKGVERTDKDVIQRSCLRVDARKWVLSKMHPTKYGNKIDVTSDNKAISTPPIIGMVIKNETETNEPTGYEDLL